MLIHERHETLKKELDNFQNELKTFISSFNEGFETGAKIHGIQEPDTKITNWITQLNQLPNLIISLDVTKNDEEKTIECLVITYGKLRHSEDSKVCGNCDELKISGILWKYYSDISFYLQSLRAVTDVFSFYEYESTLKGILNKYFFGSFPN